MSKTESQSAEALELCPFCDAESFISWDGDKDNPNDWSAVCDNTMKCGATIGGMSTESDARTAWNTRSRTLSVSVATVDNLVAALTSIEHSAPECECEHDNEYCCVAVGEFCARCWAHVALVDYRAAASPATPETDKETKL